MDAVNGINDTHGSEEMREVFLPILPGVGDYPWEGGLNGKFYRIKRGVKVKVPASVARLIYESESMRRQSCVYTEAYRHGIGKRLG